MAVIRWARWMNEDGYEFRNEITIEWIQKVWINKWMKFLINWAITTKWLRIINIRTDLISLLKLGYY